MGAALGDARSACRAADEVLNETLFPSLAHARATLADWRDDYNVDRPHSGIGWQTPNKYAATLRQQRGLTRHPMTRSAPAPAAQPAQLDKNCNPEPRSGWIKLGGNVNRVVSAPSF